MTNNIRQEIIGTAKPIANFTTHPRNVRQGDVGAIVQSLEAHGQYRPIVVHLATNQILAGNHTYLAAKSLGWDKIAATFVDCDDEQAMRILIADNRTNDLATYDDEGLAQLLKELADTNTGLQGTSFDGDALDQLLNDLKNQLPETDPTSKYSQALKVPQYEIVGEQPQTSELTDYSRAEKLQKQIEQSDLPNDLRQFLVAATTRHIVFNYAKIAEFYPHQTPEVQKLMEQSVLIIIDADDAIANGYATFDQTITTLRELDDDYA